MTDLERAFTEGLRRVDELKSPVAPLDPATLVAKADRTQRAAWWPAAVGWVAVAAALVLVVGIGVTNLGGSRTEPTRAVSGGVETRATLNLVGPLWQVSQLGGQPVVAVSGQVPSLQFFADGELVAHDWCNAISGTYLLAGDRLSFILAAATEKGCDVQQQQEFRAVLGAGSSSPLRVEMTGAELRLFDHSGTLRMVLQAEVLTSGASPAASPKQPSPSAAPSVFDQVRKRADAPPAVTPNAQRVACGEITLSQGGQVAEPQRHCLVAYTGVSDAELAVAVPTTEGDLIFSFYERSIDGGLIRVYTSTHRDRYGPKVWLVGECAVAAADSWESLRKCAS